MKKPFNYRELSSTRCTAKNCGNRIKKNIIARKGDGKALLCYKCHTKARKIQRNKSRERNAQLSS